VYIVERDAPPGGVGETGGTTIRSRPVQRDLRRDREADSPPTIADQVRSENEPPKGDAADRPVSCRRIDRCLNGWFGRCDLVPLVLRLTLAVVMFAHGAQKSARLVRGHRFERDLDFLRNRVSRHRSPRWPSWPSFWGLWASRWVS